MLTSQSLISFYCSQSTSFNAYISFEAMEKVGCYDAIKPENTFIIKYHHNYLDFTMSQSSLLNQQSSSIQKLSLTQKNTNF